MRNAKVDQNQKDIVTKLRRHGLSVLHLSTVGKGCPDLLVGHDMGIDGKLNYLFEIKNPKANGKLNPMQQQFRLNWNGHFDVIESADEALRMICDNSRKIILKKMSGAVA